MKTKKLLALAMAAVLLVAVTVAGTVAYLTAESDPVENTFTPTSLNVGLEETERPYVMIPATSLDKDPKVTYSTDVAAWVFVKVTESIGNVTLNGKTLTFDDFIDYAVVDGWIRLDGTNNREEGVYYKELDANAASTGDVVIEDAAGNDNKVTVNESVDKDMMDALKKAYAEATEEAKASVYPKLTFKSYIIQQAGFQDANDAWTNGLNSGN